MFLSLIYINTLFYSTHTHSQPATTTAPTSRPPHGLAEGSDLALPVFQLALAWSPRASFRPTGCYSTIQSRQSFLNSEPSLAYLVNKQTNDHHQAAQLSTINHPPKLESPSCFASARRRSNNNPGWPIVVPSARS